MFPIILSSEKILNNFCHKKITCLCQFREKKKKKNMYILIIYYKEKCIFNARSWKKILLSLKVFEAKSFFFFKENRNFWKIFLLQHRFYKHLKYWKLLLQQKKKRKNMYFFFLTGSFFYLLFFHIYLGLKPNNFQAIRQKKMCFKFYKFVSKSTIINFFNFFFAFKFDGLLIGIKLKK